MDGIKTILNNQIAKFILRIDIEKGTPIDFEKVAESLTEDYSQKKVEYHEHLSIKIDEQNQMAKLDKSLFPRFVLTNGDGVYVKLGTFDNNIIIESNKYRDSGIYKDKISRIIHLLRESFGDGISSCRIGMRYINMFSCDSEKDISKVFSTEDTRIIKTGLSKLNTSRVLMMIETCEDAYQVRVQYGIPNKFYPSKITRPDLMLDIDVYSQGLQSIEDWESIIQSENHEAYRVFKEYIKEAYINKMK